MTYFARIIKSLAASPSSIVHLGSGSCAEHALYQSLEPSQIIYVEPDQYLVEAAKRTIHDTPFARVIPCAIATTIGRRVLNIANNRKFSSLLTPEKLLDFYPNIVVEQQIKVETTTIETLCRTENIEKAPNNLLVAELQGLENEVF
jgi:FkbM family methyltransferase